MSGSRRTGNPLHRLVSAAPQRAAGASSVRSRRTLALIVMVCAALLAQGCDTTPLPQQKVAVESPSPRADNAPHVTTESWSGRALSVAASADGKRVYVGTTRAGVWRSDDTGLSWRQLTAPQPGDSLTSCVDRATVEVGASCALPPLTIVALALSPRNPDLIFAAAAMDIRITQRRDGIYRSNDGGGSWQLVLQFDCGNQRVGAPTDVVFAPDDPSRLWASSECGVAYSEVPGSPKGGATSAAPGVGTAATWHLVNLAQFGGDGNVSSLAVAPGSARGSAPGARWVYACGPTQLYYSRDGGRSYIPDNTQTVICGNTSDRYFYASTSSSTSIAVVPGSPNQIYVAVRYYSNGITYFDQRPKNQPVKTHPDGTACVGVNESFPNGCGGSLWLGVFDSTPQSAAPPSWTKVASPPWYAGDSSSTFSGSVGVLTQPTSSGSGYLVLFFDTDSLSVSNGIPTATSWRRLDGPNASEICGAGASTCNQSGGSMSIHPDPDAVAITSDFALTLQPVDASSTAPAIYQRHTVVQSGSCRGLLFEVTDGGVYNTSTCGQTWDQSRDLTTLAAGMISGVPQPGSDYPALYFNTFDNADWASLDKGLTWHGFQPGCGDCDAMWTDPLQSDLMAAYTNDGRILIYKGADGRAPDPNTTSPVAIPFPPTLGPYGAVVADWTRGVGAYRMPVLTLPTEQPAPYGDFVMVAPKSTNFPTDAKGNPDFTKLIPMTVWRYQGPADGTVGAWQQVGLDVPPGASVIAAAGGHQNPVYYVADRVVVGGQVYNQFAQGNHLFRSHQTGGKLDGWDCIVPGPANSGVHDGQCAAPHPDATHPGQAWTFQSDPYDPKVVYVEDSDGIKFTTDGGGTWRTDAALTAWLTGHGTIGPQCVGLFCAADPVLHELAHIEFVPNEPGTRFATGEEGVFFTTDADSSSLLGAHWHRLLSASALACAPNWSFFDPAPLGQRTLYVACTGRSLLSFVGIPRRADPSGAITIEEKPIKVQPGGAST